MDRVRLLVKGTSFESIPQECLCALRFYGEMIQLARGPEPGRLKKIRDLTSQGRERSAMISVLGAFAGKVYYADMKRQAQLRCMAALLAAERSRIKHNRPLTGWNELVPAYFAEIPNDPYDDQPIRWTHADQGFILYSVGRNQVDDGGRIHYRAGPSQLDDGVPFWDIKSRRAAPTPSEEDPSGSAQDKAP
jgi:hypothetical protein